MGRVEPCRVIFRILQRDARVRGKSIAIQSGRSWRPARPINVHR